MIKSIFDHEEEPRKDLAEDADSLKQELEQMNLSSEKPKADDDADKEVRQIFSKIVELPSEPAKHHTIPQIIISDDELISEQKFLENNPQLFQTENKSPLNQVFAGYHQEQTNADESQSKQIVTESPIVFHHESKPLTTAETIRQSGLAWGAAVGLFGSIVFMMILGWILDVLTGASPFGLVGGIIIGAAVGFYQFFRVTAQIFKK